VENEGAWSFGSGLMAVGGVSMIALFNDAAAGIGVVALLTGVAYGLCNREMYKKICFGFGTASALAVVFAFAAMKGGHHDSHSADVSAQTAPANNNDKSSSGSGPTLGSGAQTCSLGAITLGTSKDNGKGVVYHPGDCRVIDTPIGSSSGSGASQCDLGDISLDANAQGKAIVQHPANCQPRYIGL
jgi:hypothetical protein